ncbi:MAG: rRNA pseudouridine synthase [Desulfobacterales bacterium]|nr:rRNA pseudouridine synthase [Desulfobacterales bacterium]MBF0397193.1 rRNA pseudouridine synthase [Desulfobacterales bacterium]
MLIRLQKFLSQAGICSRRKGEEYIKNGLIKVNGTVITELGSKIDIVNDKVQFKETTLTNFNIKPIYIALNKPEGYVTSCMHKGEKIVLDLININDRIYPIGRLDKDSRGLLILTNDGPIHNRLSHPSFNHEKEYIVKVSKPISDSALDEMAKGIEILGKKTIPAKIKRLSKVSFKIILKEGKNRQIRRMVEKFGNNVLELERVRILNIKLKNLPLGSWRFLTEKETTILKKNCLGNI